MQKKYNLSIPIFIISIILFIISIAIATYQEFIAKQIGAILLLFVLLAFSSYRKKTKQIGVGTTSVLFILLAFLWSADLNNNVCIGDNILNYIGLPIWTNGDTGFHFTLFYSLIFLIPAFILAYKHPNHLFAKISKMISLIGIFAVSIFFILIFLI